MSPLIIQMAILAGLAGLSWSLARLFSGTLPRGGSTHGAPLIESRMGGVAFVAALVLALLAVHLAGGFLHQVSSLTPDAIPPLRLAGYLWIILAAWVVGWLDDAGRIARPTAVLLLAVVALSGAGMDLALRQVALPRLGPVDIPVPLGVFLAGLWIWLGMVALNYLDGSDGVAARQGTWVALALLFCTANSAWRFDVALIAAALLGAVSGWQAVSNPRGRILLGNGGSYAMGAALAGAVLLLVTNDLQYSGDRPYFNNILTAALVLMLPLYEFAKGMLRRAFGGLPLFGKGEEALYLRHRRALGGDHAATLAFVEPFLMTFAILAAVGTRLDNPSAPSSERIVLVVLLAATTCTFYRLKVERAERKYAEEQPEA
jgi:UDP-N-acetylmuramyl pentapeptide phosphotransferase/UDP-N-acetylglucosamine-1-phosphate transferase